MALIKAKKIKSKLAVKYDEKEANSEIKNKVVLANELRKALKEGKTNKDGKGLILYYQRQVDCHDKRTCGAEVLIRWITQLEDLFHLPNFYLLQKSLT